jgi:hypothetical protein
MSHSIDLSESTFGRLQAHAEPLVDTIETVINRVLDAYEANEGDARKGSGLGVRSFSPAGPPNLAHTKVLSAELCGRTLPPAETNWNALLIASVREAGRRLGGAEQLKRLVVVNSVLGKKEEGGFRYLPDVGLSVQGQDANGAWRATYHLARNLGLSVSVTFVWYENEKAAFPGITGRFSVASDKSVGRRPIDMQRVKAIIDRSSARPVLDPRPPDEIVGYDEYGIPR